MNQNLPISTLEVDPEIQFREGIDDDAVTSYAQDIENGNEFPPITVFHDGEKHWIADGFHRVEAFKKARKNSISAEVREGGKRDAILHSVGANATHGLRLTNADKRRAVDRMLKDEEWAKWSDREIAKHCGVAPNTVGARRKKSSAQFAQKGKSDKTRTVKRGNTTYEQNTGSIGKGKQTSFRHDQQLPVDSPAPTGDAGFCTSESLRHLRKIEKNDPDRVKALLHVKNWIDKELETHSAPGSTHLP